MRAGVPFLLAGAGIAAAFLVQPGLDGAASAALAASAAAFAGRTWGWRWAWTVPVFVAASGVAAPLGLLGACTLAVGIAAAAWTPPAWRGAAAAAAGAASWFALQPALLSLLSLAIAAGFGVVFAYAAAQAPARVGLLRGLVRASVATPAILLAAALPFARHLGSTHAAVGAAAVAALVGLQGVALLLALRSADPRPRAAVAAVAALGVAAGALAALHSVSHRVLLASVVLLMAVALPVVPALAPVGPGRWPRGATGLLAAALTGVAVRPLLGA